MTRLMCLMIPFLPLADEPAALLLRASGPIQVVPAEGEPLEGRPRMLLYQGDRLTVGEGGEAVLVYQGGARETLRPEIEATIGLEGTTPAEAVADRREANGRAVSSALAHVRPAGGDGRTTAVVARAVAEKSAVTPILNSTIVSDRPELAWPPVEGREADLVVLANGPLKTGADRPILRGRPVGNTFIFPPDRPPLKRGFTYHWRVTDQDRKVLAAGEFRLASEAEEGQVEELRELAETGDPADRMAAAWALESLGAMAEALAVTERLVEDSPDDPAYREALEALRGRIGLDEADEPEPEPPL